MMIERKTLAAILVCLLVMGAGCIRTEPGPVESVFFQGEIDTSEPELAMNGTLDVGGGNNPVDRYENVSVNLYYQNGTLIRSEQLGDLDESSRGLEFSISTAEVPYYITFESPDFRGEDVTVNYYCREQGEHDFTVHTATTKSEIFNEC